MGIAVDPHRTGAECCRSLGADLQGVEAVPVGGDVDVAAAIQPEGVAALAPAPR